MSESQLWVLFVFSGVFGLVIGSFLNVCIFRLPRNCMSIVKPRSRCPKCLTWIAWYDNLPVVSWLALFGKCRRCKNPISIRYTLVELLTGALFLVAGWRMLWFLPSHPLAGGLIYDLRFDAMVRFALEAWFVSAMIVCTFIDLEFRIIPDEVSLSGIVIGLASAVAFPSLSGEFMVGRGAETLFRLDSNHAIPGLPGEPHVAALLASLAGATLGSGAIYAVGILGKILFRKRVQAAGEEEAMGLGDVKFMAMVGAVLGWRGVLLTFLIACLWGSVFGIGKLIVKRRMGYVPFGPFLAIGALTMLFVPELVNRGIRGYMQFNHDLLERFMR